MGATQATDDGGGGGRRPCFPQCFAVLLCVTVSGCLGPGRPECMSCKCCHVKNEIRNSELRYRDLLTMAWFGGCRPRLMFGRSALLCGVPSDREEVQCDTEEFNRTLLKGCFNLLWGIIRVVVSYRRSVMDKGCAHGSILASYNRM